MIVQQLIAISSSKFLRWYNLNMPSHWANNEKKHDMEQQTSAMPLRECACIHSLIHQKAQNTIVSSKQSYEQQRQPLIDADRCSLSLNEAALLTSS